MNFKKYLIKMEVSTSDSTKNAESVGVSTVFRIRISTWVVGKRIDLMERDFTCTATDKNSKESL
jgi:hypothetical protein